MDPAKGQNWFIQTRQILYQGVKYSRLVEILPAATYSRISTTEEGKMKTSSSVGDISLTAKVGITSDLILDGTYNPDFSQVEADADQVDFNLRYSLFFPETRPIFQFSGTNGFLELTGRSGSTIPVFLDFIFCNPKRVWIKSQIVVMGTR